MIKQITTILENHPNCRERSKRGKVMGQMLKEKYPHELKAISLQRIEDILKDILLMDRYFRDIQLNNESLRGQDWEDKKILEQTAEIKLGYEVGYAQNIKQAKSL